MGLELSEKSISIGTYTRLNGNLGYGDTTCGFVLQVMRDNTKILVVKNMYMRGAIIERNVLEFNNEQQSKDYCLSYVKDLDDYVKCENKQEKHKKQSLFN